MTDLFATSWVYSTGSGVMQLGFSDANDQSVFINNGDGIDLSIFFVSAPPHSVTLTLFNDNVNLGSLSSDTIAYTDRCIDDPANINGSCSDPGDFPIYVMDIDFSSFGITASMFDSINLDVSNASAVPSLVGAYDVTPIPVPAAVWLFASGLMALGFVMRRSPQV